MIEIDNNPDIKLTTEEVMALMARPYEFGFIDDPALVSKLFITWSIGPIIETRDSTIIQQANAAELEKLLAGRSDLAGKWQIIRVKHSLHGWVKHLTFEVLETIPEIVNLEANLKSATERAMSFGNKPSSLYSEQAAQVCAQIQTAIDDARVKYGEQRGIPGKRLSKVAKVITAWQHILADVGISNEDRVNKLEYEAVLESIRANGANLVVKAGPGGWVEAVHDWLAEFDNGALSNHNGHGAYVGRDALLPALWTLELLDAHDRADLAELMLDVLYCFMQWGMQSKSSMIDVMDTNLKKKTSIENMRAAFSVLLRLGLIVSADSSARLRYVARQFPNATAVDDLANATPDNVLYVRR